MHPIPRLFSASSAKLRVDGQKAKASVACFWHVRDFFFMKTPGNNFSVIYRFYKKPQFKVSYKRQTYLT